MELPKTRTRYVHISSKHRLAHTDEKADLKVHFSQPINNVVRMAVKQFSMANASFNIITGENKLQWVEFWSSTAFSGSYLSKTFEITIPVGYYTAAALATTINTLITAIPNHKVQSVDPGETSLGMVFSQDQTNYNINVSLTYGGTGSKYMAPRNGKNNLWKLLGFSETQVLNIMKRKIRGINDTDEPNFSDILGGLPSTSAYPSVVLAGTSGTPFVLSGVFPATIESPEGMFITSETLTTGGTYETRINQDTLHMEAFPTSILEFIHYNSDRFSWIHYNTSTPHYHYLNKTSIHELDIQLRSANMTILSHKEIGEYNMVLVFECLAEPEFGPKFIKEWNDEGYRMAHEKERVIGF